MFLSFILQKRKMTNKNYLFTSESVSEGHPDKVCDRISDMVVDTYLSKDPFSRVACETLTTTNKVVLAGETRGPKLDKEELITQVRNCIKDIGYDQKGFSWKTADIETRMRNPQIWQWELTPRKIRTKAQATKVYCLAMHVKKLKI